MITQRPDLLRDRLDEVASEPSRDVIVNAGAAWHEGSRRRWRRRTQFVAATVAVGVAAGLGLSSILGSQPTPVTTPSEVSSEEIAFATAAAREELAMQTERGATVTSATFVAEAGTVLQSNTGDTCTSGRILVVRLIGTFPGIVTSGLVGVDGDESPDSNVHAVTLTVDAVTGVTCRIGVETGEVAAAPNATALDVN